MAVLLTSPLAALIALLALGASATATPIDVGSAEIRLEAEILPAVLPRFEPTPVSAQIGVSITTDDDRLPPKLRRVELSLDRHIALHLGRSERCHKGQLKNTSPSQAMRACRPALLGSGRAQAIVAYPGQRRFRTRGRVLVFAGSSARGARRLLVHSFFPRPIRATSVSVAEITRAPGPRFGDSLTVKTPKIAGGNGRLASIRLRLGTRAEPESGGPLVEATCPTRRLAILTRVTFARPLGGLSGATILPCDGSGSP
jgi:hypothetical protein